MSLAAATSAGLSTGTPGSSVLMRRSEASERPLTPATG